MRERLEPDSEAYSPITSADDPWDELRVGEYAVAIGAIRGINRDRSTAQSLPPTITIGFSDWTELLVVLPDGIPPGLDELRKDFRMIHFKLIRTENGFEGVAVWEPGGVPIPLKVAA